MTPSPKYAPKRTVLLAALFIGALAALLPTRSALAQTSYEPYAFTTYAGVAKGSTDGAASAARFRIPSGTAVDSSGNVYVADTNNHTIRKITSAGVVTTLAGTPGVFGFNDGTGPAAQFDYPQDVAVDGSGNVYVADTGNDTIRKITPGGVVTTFAGTATVVGSKDGTGTAALFNGPYSLVVDSSGNIIVADTGNFTIRKITPAGVVSTYAGAVGILGSSNGTGTAANFGSPSGVAVDSSGNIYVADSTNNEIRKVAAGGVVTTLAGVATKNGSGHADGTGGSAQFNNPYGVACDSAGNVYVADTNNNTIRKVTSGGTVTTLAGTAPVIGSADATGSSAEFFNPVGIAVDSSGNLFVADADNCTIRKVTSGGTVTTFAGVASPGSDDGTGTSARFWYPQSVSIDGSGNLYVADVDNSTVRKIAPGAVVSTLAGSPKAAASNDGTGSAARFNYPYGADVNNSGNIIVADTQNDTIRNVTPGGVVTTIAGQPGSPGSTDGTGTAARFNYPYSTAVDAAGNTYIADTVNNTIRKMTTGGVVTTLAGMPQSPGSSDGTGSAALFNLPFGVAVDGGGNIIVADTYNHLIRKVTPAGVVTTIAGSAKIFGNTDGTGSAALFYYPEGVAVDPSGNIYVGDTGNDLVRKITPAGVVTTLAGVPLLLGSSDGTGSAATFSGPGGIALDPSGNLYVADISNNTIRFGQPTSFTPTPTPSPTPTPVPGSQTARLTNLSVRSTAGSGAETLIAGFDISGSGSKSVLLRGDGPVLSQFSVSGVLPDPVLTLFSGATPPVQLDTNAGWGTSATSASTFMNVFGQVGAFNLPTGSKDAAILTTLAAGPYTANISSTTGDSGVVLVEVYDADTGTPPTRFHNVSARSEAGSGSQTLIVGFAIAGSGTETVLIRGVGPQLNQFGVTGTLSAPQLTLYDTATTPNIIATNVGWGNASTRGSSSVQATVSTATQALFGPVGAFDLTAGSADCAMVVTLPPGSYTAEVTGANSTTGVALVEVYEVQ
jgi:hypothetical protein